MAYSGGSGTLFDPYLIASQADMTDLRDGVDRAGRFFALADDIDMSGHSWTEPGVLSCHLDGRGHSIENFDLDMTNVDKSAALFSTVQRGYSLRNVRIATGTAGLVSHGGWASSGIICGEMYEQSVVENVIVRGRIDIRNYHGGGAVGVQYQISAYEGTVFKNIICLAEVVNCNGGSWTGPIIGHVRSSSTFAARNIFWSSQVAAAGSGTSNTLSSVEHCLNLTDAQAQDLASYTDSYGWDATLGQKLKLHADGYPAFDLPAVNPDNGSVSGLVQVDGNAAQRDVIAISADTVNGRRVVVGEATSSAGDGSYSLLLANFTEPVIVVALDQAGQRWAASTAYTIGDRVYPTGVSHNGLVYQCTASGTSDASEPSWPSPVGETVDDGTTSWEAIDYFRPLAHGPVIPLVV